MIDPIRSAFLSLIVATALAPALLAGNVLVVDAAGGGNFATIQPAVDAATNGDTILVKRGAYPGFTIDDKSLSVVADSGQVVLVGGKVQVVNLAATHDVVLARLNVRGISGDGRALIVDSCPGSVRVEDCNLDGGGCSLSNCYSAVALQVHASSDLSFARCAIRGGEGGFAGSGAEIYTAVRAALYDCTLVGGSSSDGIGGQYCEQPDGGNGASCWNTFLFASGSVFQGGDGGIGETSGGLGCGCGPGSGNGGNGLWLDGTGFLLDIAAFPGQGAPNPGCPSNCCAQYGQCCPGGPGVPLYAPGAALLGGTSRHLRIPNPQREHSSVPIEIRGEPGDDVYLFLSRGTSFRYVSGFRGVQLTKQPGPPVHLGVVPQNGVLNPHYDMPDLGGSVQSRTYYFQAALRDPQGVWTFTSPVSLVVLDQAF